MANPFTFSKSTYNSYNFLILQTKILLMHKNKDFGFFDKYS